MDWGEFGKKIIGKKMIVLLLVTGAVYFFLQYLTPLSAPVLLAMLFVTIFGPMMKRMNQRLHFPRPLSAIVLLIVPTVPVPTEVSDIAEKNRLPPLPEAVLSSFFLLFFCQILPNPCRTLPFWD
jgi:hypothetical protein